MLWSEETHLCPKCGTALCRSGWRKRSVIALDGITDTYWIRRLYCSKCKKIHHELPDFMVPFKRYSAQTIENILDGSTWAAPCYESTMRLIRNWFGSIAGELLKLIDKHYPALNKKQKPISSLQEIKKACGSIPGWLSIAVMLLVKSEYYEKTTHLLL